jgi:hypothetical protein
VTVNPSQDNPKPPGRSVRRRYSVKPELQLLPAFTHPDVVYWYDDWKKIRDCIEGEKAIKAEGSRYLPKFEGMEQGDYDAYLDGGTFYNFTGRTVKAMVGSIFKRRPVVTGLPETLKTDLTRITRVANSFNIFAKFIAREILSMGRVGVLVDYPAASGTSLKPYVAAYTAENILDWETALDPVTGRVILSRVVLREFELQRSAAQATQYYARYRELFLENDGGKLVYKQRLYTNPAGSAELKPEFAQEPVTVQRRGETLPYIPFRIFGSMMSEACVEAPPLLDIAHLNLSHYRSYAHLEHGRFYTGFPIYTVTGNTGEDQEYELGPMKVWVLPLTAEAKLLEMNGQGLKFLENACEMKEAQAAALGGRMIGVTTRSVSESDNQVKLKERNEVSLLLDVAHSLDEGFSFVLRVWAWMSGERREVAEAIEAEFNKDFILDMAGAREFRAVHAMYLDGVVPIDVVYDYLRKYEVIPDWMSVEEFKKLLDSMKQFPNQPDAQARKEGFPTKQSQIDEERAEDDADREDMRAEMAAEASERQAAQVQATRQFNQPPPRKPGGTQ